MWPVASFCQQLKVLPRKSFMTQHCVSHRHQGFVNLNLSSGTRVLPGFMKITSPTAIVATCYGVFVAVFAQAWEQKHAQRAGTKKGSKMSHVVSLRTQISLNPPPMIRHVTTILAVLGHTVMTPESRLAKPRRRHQKHRRSAQLGA